MSACRSLLSVPNAEKGVSQSVAYPLPTTDRTSGAKASADEDGEWLAGDTLVTNQLHLSFDAAVGRQVSATLDLNESMALFLIAFSAVLVMGLGFAAAVIIARALRRK